MITAIDDKTALVLIDLQKGIVKAALAHPVEDILNKSVQLINAFRNTHLPIVIVNVNPVGASWTKARVEKPSIPQNTITQTIAKVAMPLLGSTDIVPEVITQPTDIFITKKTWNAFYNTGLHDELQKKNVTEIILAGVATSIGVEGTARAASELGYNIAFATDAMTDRVLDAHNNSINYIFPRIGELDVTDNIVRMLGLRK